MRVKGCRRCGSSTCAAELKAGNTGLFSAALSEALAATLAAGEQAILFLNRRGSASYVFCRKLRGVDALSPLSGAAHLGIRAPPA